MDLDLGGIFVQNVNFSYDDDYVNEEDCALDAHAVFLPFMCSLALIVGIPGLVLLLTLLVRKRHWSVMDTLALNLAVADGLMLVTLPFWSAQAIQSGGWSFGAPFCKMCGAVFNVGKPGKYSTYTGLRFKNWGNYFLKFKNAIANCLPDLSLFSLCGLYIDHT